MYLSQAEPTIEQNSEEWKALNSCETQSQAWTQATGLTSGLLQDPLVSTRVWVWTLLIDILGLGAQLTDYWSLAHTTT